MLQTQFNFRRECRAGRFELKELIALSLLSLLKFLRPNCEQNELVMQCGFVGLDEVQRDDSWVFE